MTNQSLWSSWTTEADNPHSCLAGKLFDKPELHDTDLGQAHRHLNAVLPLYYENSSN